MAMQREWRPYFEMSDIRGAKVEIHGYEIVDEEDHAAADLPDEGPSRIEEDHEMDNADDDGLLHVDNKTSRESI
jgi:hypothetical protein